MITKPWLYLPSSFTHFVHPFALSCYSKIKSGKPFSWRSLEWEGLHFPNPLGTAGGLDKNARHIKDYWSLGAGFVEVGTVTPEPQTPNKGKILDRSLRHLSLWNHMGFPYKGIDCMRENLEKLFGDISHFKPEDGKSSLLKKPSPLFINIGKNRQTPLDKAIKDYKKGMELLHPFADAFIINISSPNTKDLRQIFKPQYLSSFLKSLVEIRSELKPISHKNIPLILKLSPDEEDWLRVIEESACAGIEGWCLTNTTKQRPVPGLFPEERGGISGKLLKPMSLNMLKELRLWLQKNKRENKLVISCGGVLTPEDVFERLEAGADLVQVYSALVFKGYSFFQSVYKQASSV